MKITRKETKEKKLTFGELKVGDTFVFVDEGEDTTDYDFGTIWMKIERYDHVNTVSLEEGNACHSADDEEVKRVKAELIYEVID